MGGLLVGGLLIKTIGWRAILVSSLAYGGVYAYERLTWTNNAKCKEFKRQYVEHAARKLRLVVDMTSANCSHQVKHKAITPTQGEGVITLCHWSQVVLCNGTKSSMSWN